MPNVSSVVKNGSTYNFSPELVVDVVDLGNGLWRANISDIGLTNNANSQQSAVDGLIHQVIYSFDILGPKIESEMGSPTAKSLRQKLIRRVIKS